jgi:hypothetical protein
MAQASKAIAELAGQISELKGLIENMQTGEGGPGRPAALPPAATRRALA